ncbi:hypothetical protein BDN72DRAFT_724977, partial [Pluteus cervinus]
VNNLRSSYAALENRITTALRTHGGDPAFLSSFQQEVTRYGRVAEEHANVFPVDELGTLRQSLSTMLACLEEAAQVSRDPPDVSAIHNPMIATVSTGRRGRPRKEINRSFMEQALETSSLAQIARELKCHVRTVRRRAIEIGLREPCPPMFSTTTIDGEDHTVLTTATAPVSTLSDEYLDREVLDILHLFPFFGKRMIKATLLTRGHNVPMPRIRNLIRWKFVTHAFIDGKSRFLTGIRAHSNNRSDTVLNLFMEATNQYGWPSRISLYSRVSPDLCIFYHRSPHNCRIERCWLDYAHGVVAKWKPFLMTLEAHHGLDPDN